MESTVNRVGDSYCDQIELTGHDRRLDDLDRFAALGLRTLRYPLLWERTAPGPLAGADWSWADQRVERLGALGLEPIVGLVHHGSGPRHTSLLDPAWPGLLADYALALARRYPHLSRYTPVNEPLTTARFSGLYGLWYPHASDDRSFAIALIHQIQGIVQAMAAIRRVNPDARLIQTEDLGYVRSTAALAYQAEFENERRWLTFDLLSGNVNRTHPMWGYLRWAGVAEDELLRLTDKPCPPDLFGLNYYVLSERYLDDDPAVSSGCLGNGRDRYADLEAVRVCGLVGLEPLLQQAAARFPGPFAVTEAHLAGTREEQLRWLVELWDAALLARDRGVDVRALTVWSLLGAWDWDSLCTVSRGRYEAGAFDVRGPEPRPTALARAVKELAMGRRPEHPVLASPGWWHRCPS
jgi:dTDP-4-dehydrorhamnose reductase